MSKNPAEEFANASKPRSIRGLFVWAVGWLILVAVDLLSRTWCFSGGCGLANGFFGLESYKNYGFAFSLPLSPLLMYTIYALVLGFIGAYIVRSWRAFSTIAKLSWTLIIAGAVVNVGERVCLGYVRDFIKINTGYLNLADFWIMGGVLLLLFQSFRAKK
jgi:signal peptidase II